MFPVTFADDKSWTFIPPRMASRVFHDHFLAIAKLYRTPAAPHNYADNLLLPGSIALTNTSKLLSALRPVVVRRPVTGREAWPNLAASAGSVAALKLRRANRRW